MWTWWTDWTERGAATNKYQPQISAEIRRSKPSGPRIHPSASSTRLEDKLPGQVNANTREFREGKKGRPIAIKVANLAETARRTTAAALAIRILDLNRVAVELPAQQRNTLAVG